MGIFALLSGLFIGLYGCRFLRPTAGMLVGITTLCTTLVLSSIFGFFQTVLGIILTIVTAILISVICRVITLHVIWFAIGGFGILGGFFFGSLVYELKIMQFDFAHEWGASWL